MIRKILLVIFSLSASYVSGHDVLFTPSDSVRIESMLTKAKEEGVRGEKMIYFAKNFLGTPYVSHTLDGNAEEHLVVNLSGLDCTTFVETILALSLCADRELTTFRDFCDMLRRIRYIDGKVEYIYRKHYFSVWMEEACRQRLVSPIVPWETGWGDRGGTKKDYGSCNARETDYDLFSAVQRLRIYYMTAHVSSYAMLGKHPEWIEGIRKMEREYTGREYRYIPKENLSDMRRLREYIHDGDIISIITSIPGLDTSHVGMALWKAGRPHLLHASSRWKKVVVEPANLYNYMLSQPKQRGIRVVRMAGNVVPD